MRKYLLLSGCLLLVGAICVAVSLQSIEVPAIDKPNLSNLKPLPIIKTINSNTIVVLQDGNESTICLAGIERPANSADLADKFLSNLLKGESVFVLPEPQQADPNNCPSAYIYRLPDGLFVNAEIIRQGYGLASMKSLFRFMKEFRSLELFAKQAGKGIWASADTISATVDANAPNKQDSNAVSLKPPPQGLKLNNPLGNDDVIVYVTKSGTKYHSQGCRFLSKSSIPMKLKEAKIRYSPCSVCKPPQ